MQEELHFLTIRELAERLSSKAVSSVELTTSYLERAEALDVPAFELPNEPRSDHGGKLSTMITIAREQALQAAQAADRELTSGPRKSILHGIPYGVKDLLDSDGIRTTWGSRIFAERVPERNAAVIDKLQDSGAVLMAKMSLGEFAGGKHQHGRSTPGSWIERASAPPAVPWQPRWPDSSVLGLEPRPAVRLFSPLQQWELQASVQPSEGSAASDAWPSPGVSTRSVRWDDPRRIAATFWNRSPAPMFAIDQR